MRIAFGVATAGGTQDIMTGLSTVVDCGAFFATAPTLLLNWCSADALVQTGSDWSKIRIRQGGYTASNDATPVQKTGATTIYWWAIGT